MKKVYAIIAIFVGWEILDFIIHSLILGSAYAAQPQLWRPMSEMKMWLIYLVTLIFVIVFVLIYTNLIKEKSMKSALTYGLLFGFGTGISMGYGTYASMPIPHSMALV